MGVWEVPEPPVATAPLGGIGAAPIPLSENSIWLGPRSPALYMQALHTTAAALGSPTQNSVWECEHNTQSAKKDILDCGLRLAEKPEPIILLIVQR